MKIPELRARVKELEASELGAILIEMYKAMPKKTIEDNQIDQLIANPESFLAKEKRDKSKAKNEPVDMAALTMEIEQFMAHAKADYFIAPNRVIPKRERPKWRFMVKRYVDALMAAAADEAHRAQASKLLEGLYTLLCAAGGYDRFNTEDPFRSVGIYQPDFYAKVVSLKQQTEPALSFVRDSILLIIDSDLSPNVLREDLMMSFQTALRTPPLREMAVEVCESLLKTSEAEYRKMNIKPNRLSWESLDIETEINVLAELEFRLYMGQFEKEQAVEAFKRHYIESNHEMRRKSIILLQLLREFELPDLWVREYSKAKLEGEVFADYLNQRYEYIVKNGSFPPANAY